MIEKRCYKKFSGFTLAETLITLAIIGVVAALTIPNLIYSYKKRVIETRLAHFSSLWQQAFRMAEAEHGESSYWEGFEKDNPESVQKAYEKYLGKYIKTVDSYKTPKGIAYALNNGSGFHLRKTADEESWRSNFYLNFCVNFESCKNIKDTTNTNRYSDGKEIFSFFETGLTPNQYGGIYYDTREQLLEDCKTVHYACTTLIERDGWKIKDDYPVKI